MGSVIDLIGEILGSTGGQWSVAGSVAIGFGKWMKDNLERKGRERIAKFEAKRDVMDQFNEDEREEISSRCGVARAMIFDALADELDKSQTGSLFTATHSVRIKSANSSLTPDMILIMTDKESKDAMDVDVYRWYKKNWKDRQYDKLDSVSLDEAILEDSKRFRDIFVSRVKKDAGKCEIRNKVLDSVFSYDYALCLYAEMIGYSIRHRLALEKELEEVEKKEIIT